MTNPDEPAFVFLVEPWVYRCPKFDFLDMGEVLDFMRQTLEVRNITCDLVLSFDMLRGWLSCTNKV